MVITYAGGSRPYPYSSSRVRLLLEPRRVELPAGSRIEVDGTVWSGNVSEVLAFGEPQDPWWRVFYLRADGTEHFRTYPSSRVRILSDAAQSRLGGDVLGYLREVVRRLPVDDHLRRVYARMDFVHPQSVLARYVTAGAIEPLDASRPSIFPFRRNASQWTAVERALAHPVSVIEGPPGTGKTETILNIVTSVVLGGGTVGVVSSNNAAVDNVREKLDAAGFGDLVATLGREERRADFFGRQQARNLRLTGLLRQIDKELAEGQTDEDDEAAELAALDGRLRTAYSDDLERARLHLLVDAFRLEHRHFIRHLDRQELPDLRGLPLLRKSSRRILEFLAETQPDVSASRRGLLQRLRRYLRYGSLKGLAPDDVDVVLGLQQAFYERRIDELGRQLEEAEAKLRTANFDSLTERHQVLSRRLFLRHVAGRYEQQPPGTYSPHEYRKQPQSVRFTHDYPVVLSTCHSLSRSLPDGQLLDHLVIDEASQVDLLSAAAALSCCRNVTVVGDLQQLGHIDSGAGEGLTAPSPAYAYDRHSILSSLAEVYGESLPTTLLAEHYRCDPGIIEFCNRVFYDGRLVPYSRGGSDSPMLVVPTPPGHHMRVHRAGGRTNQREIDVIAEEVMAEYCQGIPDADIGVTTPYRRQVEKARDVLDRHDVDTVHRFQGRQKRVVILSTVVDDTWRGQRGLPFVDDPRLVNVAVSRAVERFILVTDSKLQHRSRYLNDLIGYIGYLDPHRPLPESSVVSVFDLLYQEYSDLLRPLAQRVGGLSDYRSENIVDTVLTELLQEEPYRGLALSRQVLLRNLLPSLAGLTDDQLSYVRHRASVDFVVYNRITNSPTLAVEVDGFAFHENDPQQQRRDRIKDAILEAHGLPLLRLPTTGSGEVSKLRAALSAVEPPLDTSREQGRATVIDVRPRSDSPNGGA